VPGDGEGIVQRTNGNAVPERIAGIERCSVKKIRRLTACRFDSGPGHQNLFGAHVSQVVPGGADGCASLAAAASAIKDDIGNVIFTSALTVSGRIVVCLPPGSRPPGLMGVRMSVA